jgi:hypothetical protein
LRLQLSDLISILLSFNLLSHLISTVLPFATSVTLENEFIAPHALLFVKVGFFRHLQHADANRPTATELV